MSSSPSCTAPALESDPAELDAQADVRFVAGAWAESLALKRQALSLYTRRRRLDHQARCQQGIGHLCLLLRDHAGAQQAYREAIRLRTELNEPHGMATAWGRLAEVLQQQGDHAGALQAFDQSLAALRRCNALKDLGIVLNNMAVSYRETGEAAKALQCHQRALEIRRDLGDREGLAASLHNIGVLNADAGADEAAREAFEEAHRLRALLGDRAGLASTEVHLGLLHEKQGQREQATACYERAMALSEAVAGDFGTQAAALCNMAGLLVAQGEPGRALLLLDRARALLRGDTETPQWADLLFNQGMALIASGDEQQGMDALSAAQRIQQRCGDVRRLSATLSAQAIVMAGRRAWQEAEHLLLQALEIQARLGEYEASLHALKLLGQVKANRGDSEGAAQVQTQARRLSLLVDGAGLGGRPELIDWRAVMARDPQEGERPWLLQ